MSKAGAASRLNKSRGFTSVIKKATELPTAAQPKLAFQPDLFGEKTCRAPRFLSSANLILL